MKQITLFVLLLVSVLFADQNEGIAQGIPSDSSQVIADEIIKSEIPVLIDFWAVWCKPCDILSPMIQEIKKQYAGKILVRKVNVDVHKKIASYFRVNSIPSIYIIKNKTVVKFIPGVQPKEVYVDAIEQVIGNTASAAGKAPPPN